MNTQTDPPGTDPADDTAFELNQDEATKILEGSDFDTELGRELARDAIAVANGDLDEATFHDRHHEAVIDEFGVDERPTGDGQ
ncbi:hypothetical protein HTSR_0518 [Halodesulfurarchaeum formicicum]|uniref:4Fe-4S ferredoxin iron-sulfur binding domain-containing protein n=1 Tax=Halodesulfurarchaeum formicicum TaxID=1873524 RepID=A0A1D8S2X8_9EURY|nr:4Fe-4S ferredoxin N-terminal domain-containing protein [Halodesulfurarchaeum formicicum]AOW79714.1 hypothetical protein HTSR_0518 [Halodesulfurarchaeum formicicum]APE94964.1 hypothetical protein HSR6_0502 [Halodesulfurarchaeum formicicum]